MQDTKDRGTAAQQLLATSTYSAVISASQQHNTDTVESLKLPVSS